MQVCEAPYGNSLNERNAKAEPVGELGMLRTDLEPFMNFFTYWVPVVNAVHNESMNTLQQGCLS